MKKKNIFIVTLFIIINCAYSQSMVGLWEVVEVSVGEKKMTPVAKWMRINKDNTYESGNGWTQNSIGTWTFDKSKKEYSAANKNGVKDPFGAFKVSFLENKITLKRTEDGMEVIVNLKAITKLPMTTVDKLVGLWNLTKASKETKDITRSYNSERSYFILFRPDRLYLEPKEKSQGKKSNGYWFINGHRPIVTLFNKEEFNTGVAWKIEVSEDQLTLYGTSEKNKKEKLIFKRVSDFD